MNSKAPPVAPANPSPEADIRARSRRWAAAALGGLFLASCSTAPTSPQGGASSEGIRPLGICRGANSCKGMSDCGGKSHQCAGLNGCKGQGWKKTTPEECARLGGQYES